MAYKLILNGKMQSKELKTLDEVIAEMGSLNQIKAYTVTYVKV